MCGMHCCLWLCGVGCNCLHSDNSVTPIAVCGYVVLAVIVFILISVTLIAICDYVVLAVIVFILITVWHPLLSVVLGSGCLHFLLHVTPIAVCDGVVWVSLFCVMCDMSLVCTSLWWCGVSVFILCHVWQVSCVHQSVSVWQRVVGCDTLTVEQRQLLESFSITVSLSFIWQYDW